MDGDAWQVATSIGSAVLALGSLVVAAVAAGYARGQRNASTRQADAAEAQVEVMRRQVELMEQDSGFDAGRRVPYVPPWSLQYLRGDTFTLTNGGTDVEFDVKIEPPPNSAVAGALEHASIGPRASVSFMVALTLASPNRDITITWSRQPGGERLSWQTVLPAKA